jgi:hypothetical protein
VISPWFWHFIESRFANRDGWVRWWLLPPPPGLLIQIDRLDCPAFVRRTLTREELSPLINTAELYWRVTGIGRAQLEGEI